MKREEIQKAISEIDSLILRYQVGDGPRTSKERIENQERHDTVGKLTRTRKLLHNILDNILDLSIVE